MDDKLTRWVEICERAMLIPDDNRSAERVAERFTAKTGEPIDPAEIDRERDAYWAWIRSRPVIASFTI